MMVKVESVSVAGLIGSLNVTRTAVVALTSDDRLPGEAVITEGDVTSGPVGTGGPETSLHAPTANAEHMSRRPVIPDWRETKNADFRIVQDSVRRGIRAEPLLEWNSEPK